MKKLNSISMLLASAFLFIITFSSCKKNKNDTTPVTQYGTLMFHLHTDADTNEVDSYGDTMVMTGGRQIAVNMAQLYLSNIRLIKTDGTEITGPSVNVFMYHGKEEYVLGDVPVGNYKSVKFDIGLSDASNSSTPSSSDSILNQSSMWFGASAQPGGFVFVNFQGLIDTTDAMTGAQLVPFTLKMGTTSHRVTKTMPDQNFSVLVNQESVVHMIVDYAHLFSGINLKVNSNLNIVSVSDNSLAAAGQIAANMAGMISYE